MTTAVATAPQPSAQDLDAHVARAAEDQQAKAATTPHPDVLPPTPDEIDTEIAFYNNALACQKQSEETTKQYRDRLIFLVDSFGVRPAHAEQSKRLAGRRNTVTVTRGATTAVDESAVVELRAYLSHLSGNIFAQLFAAQTKHVLIEGAKDLLKKLSLPRRTEEKVFSLFGRCFEIKAKSPTVKVEVVQPEKPARKPRTGKAAA